jgi:hypothetical protein
MLSVVLLMVEVNRILLSVIIVCGILLNVLWLSVAAPIKDKG